MTGLAVAFGLLSALAAALSTSVQHQAAEGAPPSVTGAWGLIKHLIRRPMWLLGQALGLVTVAFHALALNFGPITLVQPLVISGIVLAVPVRAALSRQLPGRREVGAVLIAAAGLAAFLIVSNPSEGEDAGLGTLPLLSVLGCLLVALWGVTTASRIAGAVRRAFLLGAGAGILFGLVAVLLKLSLEEFGDGGLAQLVTTWPFFLLLVAGGGGVLTNQLAYRSGRLSSSMPVLNVVNCLLALTFGYVVFQEVPRHSPGVLAVEALALGAMLGGLWVLARDAAALEALQDSEAAVIAAP